MILRIDEVVVLERLREDKGEDEIPALMKSFQVLGQLQPIVVHKDSDGRFVLDAGERRLISARRLAEGHEHIKGLEVGEIEAVLKDNVPEHLRVQMEFDENVKRKDFNFVEKAKFIRKIHEMMVDKSGGEWKDVHTAAALRLSPASISHYLRIEEAMKTDPMVAKAQTASAAIKRMKIVEKQKVRKVDAQENFGEALKKAEDVIKLGDALELIKSIPDNSVDLINFDPPWGDDVSRKPQEAWDGFDDSTETSDHLINGLLPELFRVLKNDRVMIYWFRMWGYEDMIGRLERTGFNLKLARTPCIWHKPDRVSAHTFFPMQTLIPSYEPFFLAKKGEPVFHEKNGERLQDVFSFARVPMASLIHPTEKPIELCQTLLGLLSVPGEFVLDPTAGSGAIIDAAIRGGRRALGFELSESIRDRTVNRITEYYKTLRIVKV